MRNMSEEGCGSNYQGREYGPIREQMKKNTEEERKGRQTRRKQQRNLIGNFKVLTCSGLQGSRRVSSRHMT